MTPRQTSPAQITTIRVLAIRTLIFMVLWFVLTAANNSGWGLGLVGAILAAWLSMKLIPESRNALHWPNLLLFCVFFVWGSIKGGVQVALLALQLTPKLEPAILKVPADIEGSKKQKLLLSTLTLMPGTLGIGFEKSGITVHVLNHDVDLQQEVNNVLQKLNSVTQAPDNEDKANA